MERLVNLNKIRRMPWRKLAEGSENLVYNLPGHPDKIIAYQKGDFGSYNTEQAQKVYAVHRILNILFPENFPRVFAVFGDDAAGDIGDDSKLLNNFFSNNLKTALRYYGFRPGTGSIREKKNLVSRTKRYMEIKIPMSSVSVAFSDFISRNLDLVGDNLYNDEKNNCVFVDLIPSTAMNSRNQIDLFFEMFSKFKDQILQFLRTEVDKGNLKYNSRKIEIVENNFKRLERNMK